MKTEQGVVSNAWNTTVLKKENNVTFSCEEYNRSIEAGNSISFGFEMQNENFEELKSAVLSQDAKVNTEKETVSVSYTITSQWDKGAVIEATIHNLSDTEIRDWELAFSYNGTIDAMWNGKIISSDNGRFVVHNQEYNSTIKPAASVTFGFRASYPDTQITCPFDEIVNGTRPVGDTGENPGNTTEKDTTEREPEDTSEETINWEEETDSDGDGLPDVMERYQYHTDMENKDTDGDGLPDGYEVMHTGTNPTMSDTDGNGILDGEEDLDEDGLTNQEEYELGMEPLCPDMDEDGLLDGEEVQYETRFDKEDTDGDGISDYDEIQIGLNPLKAMTHEGIRDSEYPVEQQLTVEDLKDINEGLNEFDVSLEVKATNYLKNHMSLEISDYASLLNNNESIIGEPLCFGYTGGNITEGTIEFTLNKMQMEKSNSYHDRELGLKRYAVFTYDEKSHMLAPVPCSYDMEKSRISVDASIYSGNLCLVDLEQLLHDLGKDKEVETYFSQSLSAADRKRSRTFTANRENSSKAEDNGDYDGVTVAADICARPVDLVFNIEASTNMKGHINSIKKGLKEFVEKLEADNIALRMSFISYQDVRFNGGGSTHVNNNRNEDFVSNISDMQEIMNTIEPSGASKESSVIETLCYSNGLEYRPDATKIAVVFANSRKNYENTFRICDVDEITKEMRQNHINICVAAPSDWKEEYSYISADNNGIYISDSYLDKLYQYIDEQVQTGYAYNAIAGNNLTPVFLDDVLTKGGSCDTDKDGLTDSQEVDWSKVILSTDASGNKTAELPTLEQLWNSMGYSGEFGAENELLGVLSTQKVLPVRSFPNMEDSDGDDIIDSKDPDVLQYNPDEIDDSLLDDSLNPPDVSSTGTVSVKSMSLKKAASTISSSTIKKGTVKDGQYSCSLTTYSGKKRTYCGALKPKNNSDYIITVKSKNGFKEKDTSFKVYRKNKLGMKISVKSYKSEAKSSYTKKYYYSLKKGTAYYVEFSCKTKRKETITISCNQDNWVYAPNGGIWTADTKNMSFFEIPKSYPLKECYISRNMLYVAACESQGEYVTDKAAIANIMLKLGYNKDDYKITASEVGWTVLDTAGSIYSFYSLGFGKGFLGAAKKEFREKGKWGGFFFIGSSFSSFVQISGPIKIFNKVLKKLEYDRITSILENNDEYIRCSRMNNNYGLKTWDSWTKKRYINKYRFGVRGKISNCSSEDIIDFCGWENPNNRN